MLQGRWEIEIIVIPDAVVTVITIPVQDENLMEVHHAIHVDLVVITTVTTTAAEIGTMTTLVAVTGTMIILVLGIDMTIIIRQHVHLVEMTETMITHHRGMGSGVVGEVLIVF